MTTTLYDASVYGREAKVGDGLEYLVDMLLEEEEEADIDDIEALKQRQRDEPNEKTPHRREPDQNSEQRKPS